ncbi:DUF4203 domain-containing protein [Propionicimonas sp.]|uniref:TM7S3/TM198-like domain-containing protein n=1 Tax=Propionicimonas sp. TaxID=1955623 RepID=UPI0039E3AA7E
MVLAMDPVWVGVAEIVLGLVFCFLGYPAARVVLALWGALVGFAAGLLLQALLLQSFADNALSRLPWWVYSLVLALVLAWLAFAFYAVAVLISMGAVGWGLGQLISSALHTPGWVAFSMGLVVAAGLVMVGWALNLPKVLLIVLTALVGAGAVLDGVQVILGSRLDWFSPDLWRTDFTAHFAWTIAYVVLVILGMIVQFRQRSDDNLRDAYKRS